MSLTHYLNHDTEIRRLFAEIPNLKHFFHTMNDGPAFPPNVSSTILVKRDGPPNPAIGHAYDYWLRAYVQKLNGMHEEKRPEDLTASFGVALLMEQGKDVIAEYEAVVDRRNAFIKGELSDNPKVLHDCLLLAALETFYRSGYMPPGGINKPSERDYVDLGRLADETKKHKEFFIAQDTLFCNPNFGAASRLLGGADADLIIDNTLIEIKTESTFGYKAQHVRQLLAYYLLGRLTPCFEADVKRLAIFNPRYGRYIYLDIEEVAEEVNLNIFTDQFVDILCSESFLNNQGREIDELRTVQQEIRDYYKKQ